jgi:hypothetical protein
MASISIYATPASPLDPSIKHTFLVEQLDGPNGEPNRGHWYDKLKVDQIAPFGPGFVDDPNWDPVNGPKIEVFHGSNQEVQAKWSLILKAAADPKLNANASWYDPADITCNTVIRDLLIAAGLPATLPIDPRTGLIVFAPGFDTRLPAVTKSGKDDLLDYIYSWAGDNALRAARGEQGLKNTIVSGAVDPKAVKALPPEYLALFSKLFTDKVKSIADGLSAFDELNQQRARAADRIAPRRLAPVPEDRPASRP